MPRVIVPVNAPELGDKLDVVEGPAHGSVVGYTGTQVNFAEVANPGGYVGNSDGAVDGNQLKRNHVYKLREIEHKITAEKIWVYWYDHTDL